MATLDDIVTVDIALQTAAVPRTAFNIPLIYGPAQFDGWTRSYGAMPDEGTDGLSSEVMTALSDVFDQTPSPDAVMVGRASFSEFAVTYSDLLVGDVLTLSDVTADVDYSVTVAEGKTMPEVMKSLADAIAAGDEPNVVGSVDEDGVLTLRYVGTPRHVFTVSSELELGGYVQSAKSAATDLDAIKGENNAWYGTVSTSRDPDVQFAVATWVESHKKLHGMAGSSADILEPTGGDDILSRLKDAQLYRTFTSYHTKADTEYPEAAWMGRVFPIQAGSETWALKQLAGVTPSNLSETDRTTVFAKNGNTFEYYSSSLALTNNGKVAAGEWIDIIRGRDWLANNIQVNLIQTLINRDKVPYTDPGILLCKSNLNKSLEQGVTIGFLAPEEIDDAGTKIPSFVITAPLAADVPDDIKASRKLYLKFRARVAGAIHAAEITGSVAYSLEG
jgi:hypothetical protein